MSNVLFEILEGIYGSGCALETLADEDMVVNYAESAGHDIDYDQAKKIISVGKQWVDDIENGNGEWSRMRHEAMTALEGK